MKPKKIYRSSLKDHKRVKKDLVPPFRQLGRVDQIFWPRDLLPEFLWIDSLVQEYGQAAAASVFNDFLQTLDPLNPDSKHILDGTIAAFGRISEDLRRGFLTVHSGKAE